MTVIKVEHLSKYYKLGVINSGTFFRDMQTWIARKQGKEDPHSKIGDPHHYDATKKGFWALQDLSFDIKQGDRVGVIGRNGAGKSTILKIMSRITAPTEGSVKIKGRVASLLEVGTGFHGELTGRENIYLNGAILGMKRYEVDRKLDEIVAFSEIDKHIDTPVKRYSSGMFVKLAFAVAAHLDSEILIADEVLAVGDQAFQKKALGKMNELSTGEGRTVLFVSHNMASVKALCNKGIILEQGRLAYEADDIEDAFAHYTGSELSITENNLISSAIFKPDNEKKLQLLCIKMIDRNNKETAMFSCDENIYIKLNLLVKEKIEGCYGYLSLTDESGETVLVSDSNDVNNNAFGKMNIGENTMTITVPSRTLAAGKYKVYLNFTDSNGMSLDSPGVSCSFQINDFLTKRGNNRDGYFSTLLSWDISK